MTTSILRWTTSEDNSVTEYFKLIAVGDSLPDIEAIDIPDVAHLSPDEHIVFE